VRRVKRICIITERNAPGHWSPFKEPAIAGMKRELRDFLVPITDLDSLWTLLDEGYGTSDFEAFALAHRFQFDIADLLMSDTDQQERNAAAERMAEHFSFKDMRRGPQKWLRELAAEEAIQGDRNLQRFFCSDFITPVLRELHEEAATPERGRLGSGPGSRWYNGAPIEELSPFEWLSWMVPRVIRLVKDKIASQGRTLAATRNEQAIASFVQPDPGEDELHDVLDRLAENLVDRVTEKIRKKRLL
jgi:hypothetical protein